jgi:hypothetical protein
MEYRNSPRFNNTFFSALNLCEPLCPRGKIHRDHK